MSALDFLTNRPINAAIAENLRHIKNVEDRRDCSQEIWAALYQSMPLDEDEAIRLVNRQAKRFTRSIPSEECWEESCR